MNKIKEKLYNNRGVSFLFALLAFMVATMVSVTIITAAVSSLKRVYNDREEQQAHLTLTSAAGLIRDGMLGTKVTEKITIEDSGGGNKTQTTETTPGGPFGIDMQAAVAYVDTYLQPYSSSTSIKIQAEDMNMDAVNVTFTMQSDSAEKYRVAFTLELENSKETAFLTMNGSPGETTKTESKQDGKTVTTQTTTIEWTTPVINGLKE